MLAKYTHRFRPTASHISIIANRSASTVAAPVTNLVPQSELLPISSFTNFKLNEELSETSAHTIYTAGMNDAKIFLKDRATHKEFPVSKTFPNDPKMQLAYSKFLAQKEVLHTDIALSLLGRPHIPRTFIATDNIENPTRYFVASEELRGYTSLLEIAGKRELDEIFHVGPKGETRLTGYTTSPKTDEFIPFDVPITGRIAADKVRLFLGETDPNARNSGVRYVSNQKVIICMIDFDACGNKTDHSPEELAFSAPHSVVTALTMPEPSYKRILLRAVRKQEIFNKIANINTDELRHYVDDHFDKESHHLFKDKISLLSNNLLDAHAKFAKASILHDMACKSLGIENTEQASKTKSQGNAR